MRSSNLLFCYEKDCGGETIAVKNIIAFTKKEKRVVVDEYAVDKMTSFFTPNYFYWIFKNLIGSLFMLSISKPYDWVITTTFTCGVAAVFLKPFKRYHVCFYYHGSRLPKSDFHVLPSLFLSIKFHLVYFLHNFFLRETDLIITPSKFSVELLKQTFHIIKEKRCQVIPNGVDPKKFYPLKQYDRERVRKLLKIPSTDIIITYIGRMDSQKGIKLLINSMKFLLLRGKNIRLILAYNKLSSGSEIKYFKTIQVFTRKQNLNNSTTLFENFNNLNYIYNISDIVVLPTRQDTFPLVILESAAAKTLIIAGNTGGISEVLKRIDTRLLIKNMNEISFKTLALKIESILNLSDREKRKITMKAYAIVNNDYRWEKSADLFVKALTV